MKVLIARVSTFLRECQNSTRFGKYDSLNFCLGLPDGVHGNRPRQCFCPYLRQEGEPGVKRTCQAYFVELISVVSKNFTPQSLLWMGCYCHSTRRDVRAYLRPYRKRFDFKWYILFFWDYHTSSSWRFLKIFVRDDFEPTKPFFTIFPV